MHDHSIDCSCDDCRYFPECRECRALAREHLLLKKLGPSYACQSCAPRHEPAPAEQLSFAEVLRAA